MSEVVSGQDSTSAGNSGATTFGFEAEVDKLLQLMIHSLYSNKEIFLRELISNAADAASKLRFAALSDNSLYEDDSDLKITIDYNSEYKTITISDNATGMTYDEVKNNLGTIAKSGTQEFLDSLTGDKAKDSELIGQFGVGFYASFIVADKVVVRTRAAGLDHEKGVRFESNGTSSYTIEEIYKPDRGTEIVLHLKDSETEFLNSWRLRQIITKYSDHVNIPVVMPSEKNEEENSEKNESNEVTQEVINDASALWTIPKSDIEDEKYKEFYKKLANDYADPLCWAHNKVEGKLEYTSLLYIPTNAPFDLWQADKPRGLKLFVKRVFIMDDAQHFLPNYLRFVRGVIDTNDLSLNVSREILQSNRKVDAMRSAVTKRVLSMLGSLSNNKPEDYKKFWSAFGAVLKEGPAEDYANKELIAKLLRFSSTQNSSEEQNVSLDDYIGRMVDGQENIYYITADTYSAAKNSPHLEVFKDKKVEVLLLHSKVDEWLMSHLSEYSGKKLQSVTKGDLQDKLFDSQDSGGNKESEKEDSNDDSLKLINRLKDALGEEVKEVRYSKRLTSSPSCIVAGENDMTAHMERILKAAGQNVPKNLPILEINKEHLLIQKIASQSDEGKFNDLAQVLLEQAILAEGGQLKNPAAFVKKFNELLLEVASS